MVVQPRLGDLAAIVYRRKWLILFVALIVCAIGAGYIVTAVPQYRSEASIIVRFGQAAAPMTNLARDGAAYSTDQVERRELIQAHTDILTSPDVAEAVITKIGLAKLFPLLAEHAPAVGTLMDAAVLQFAANMYATPEPSGNVIRVGFANPNADLARTTLDALVEEYMQRESEVFTDTSYSFQKTQADLAAQRLTTAQAKMAAFKADHGISDFETQMNALIKQGSDVRGRLHVAEVSLAESTYRKQSLARLLQTVSTVVSDSSGDKYRQVDDSQARVNELRARERELTAVHGADWPAAQALRASIAEAQSSTAAMSNAASGRQIARTSEVYQGIQTDLLRVSAENLAGQQSVALMTAQAAEIQKRINELEASRADLMELQREVDLADVAYRTITLKMQDSRIDADQLRDGISSAALISEPSLPYQTFFPRYRLLALSTAASALLAGLFAAFLREWFDDRFISADQIAGRLNIPVLATFDKS